MEYNFKKIEVKSAGHRDPDAEGSEGMSASQLRGLVKAGKRDEFISHYSDKKLGAHIHDKVKANMSESKALFILGGPGSGKDYVINNILKRYDLVEVQMDQILNGAVKALVEQGADLLINGNADKDKIQLVKSILENYSFSHTIVSVTNKVSRERNATRDRPLTEQVRIRKWLDCENISFPNSFIFKNSLNLVEASQSELKGFQDQIEQYLHFLKDNDFHTLAEVLEWGTDETGEWFPARRFPHRDVDMRGVGASYRIVAPGGREDERAIVIGSIGAGRVLAECHEGAIYLHRGRSYLVTKLDADEHEVRVRAVDAPYYTQSLSEKETEILSRERARPAGNLRLVQGRIRCRPAHPRAQSPRQNHGFGERHRREHSTARFFHHRMRSTVRELRYNRAGHAAEHVFGVEGGTDGEEEGGEEKGDPQEGTNLGSQR